MKTPSLKPDTKTHADMQMVNTVMALTSGQHTSLSGVMSRMYCALALPWKDTNVRISSSSSAVWSVYQVSGIFWSLNMGLCREPEGLQH